MRPPPPVLVVVPSPPFFLSLHPWFLSPCCKEAPPSSSSFSFSISCEEKLSRGNWGVKEETEEEEEAIKSRIPRCGIQIEPTAKKVLMLNFFSNSSRDL